MVGKQNEDKRRECVELVEPPPTKKHAVEPLVAAHNRVLPLKQRLAAGCA